MRSKREKVIEIKVLSGSFTLAYLTMVLTHLIKDRPLVLDMPGSSLAHFFVPKELISELLPPSMRAGVKSLELVFKRKKG